MVETAIVAKNSPADLVREAAAGKLDIASINGLLEAQFKWEANEARKAYHHAMAAFKANPPRVVRDKQNSQYKSMYTTLGNLVNTVTPELSKNGLSASWDIKQNGLIEVTCRITHELGHFEQATAAAPADTSGAKNQIQQIKSTITYLKAVTFESVCGLASTDANLDDDGTGSQAIEYISDEEIAAIQEYIMALEVDEKKFLDYLKIESIDRLLKTDFQKALNALKAKAKKPKVAK